VIGWLTDPFGTQFMRNAAMTAVCVGVLAPTVGVWVVLRRLAYLGDAMSHGTLAGVAGAYLTGVSLTIGALAAGLVMGVLVALFDRQRRLGHDSAIGVAETLLFSVGVLLIAGSDRVGIDLSHYLFGQIVTVSGSDVLVNGLLTVAALIVVAIVFPDLRSVTFDPDHAAQVGVPVAGMRFLLVALISITVVVSLSTVGLLMSVAMLVTPAAAARLVTDRVESMTAVAVGMGVTSALGGLVCSYHLGTPPGPTIALVAVAWFGVAAGLRELRTRRPA
jgi:ABC-type Mn2+/Zn2+ transport system permease subunit